MNPAQLITVLEFVSPPRSYRHILQTNLQSPIAMIVYSDLCLSRGLRNVHMSVYTASSFLFIIDTVSNHCQKKVIGLKPHMHNCWNAHCQNITIRLIRKSQSEKTSSRNLVVAFQVPVQ